MKKQFVLLVGTLFFVGCWNVTDEPIKPTTISVVYERYITGGTGYDPWAEPKIDLGESISSKKLTEQGKDSYSGIVSIETNTVYEGYIYDTNMVISGDVYSVRVVLNVYLDGVKAIRIEYGSPQPWAGHFKFIKRNDGEIEFYKS